MNIPHVHRNGYIGARWFDSSHSYDNFDDYNDEIRKTIWHGVKHMKAAAGVDAGISTKVSA